MLRRWTRQSPCLSYVVEGRGVPVLLLHEMGGSLRSWDGVVPLLHDFQVIRLDQRGAGWSEKTRCQYSQADLCQDLSSALADADIRNRVLICAVASACATAVSFALQAPERVLGLVLCCPGMAVEGLALDSALARIELVERQGMRAVAAPAMEALFPSGTSQVSRQDYRARFLASDPTSFAFAYRAFLHAKPKMDSVATPTLLLAGVQDVRPVAEIRELCGRMPNAQIEVVERAGHVMQVHRPDAVANAILRVSVEASSDKSSAS